MTTSDGTLNGAGMNQHDSDRRIDPLLLPFLSAEDEREAGRHMEALIMHAMQAMTKITRSSRTPEDAFQEATYSVVKQLRELRAHRSESAIGNYLHYVKVVASRVVKGQVRQEHPKHRKLVDALRHVLKSEPSLALWEADSHEKLCGLATWRDRQADRIQSARLTRLLDEPRALEDVLSLPCGGMTANHVELVSRLFDWIGHPIRFDELTKIVCGLKRIQDLNPVGDGEPRGLSEWLPDTRRRPDEQAEWREFLEQVWAQIEQLPRLQRLAYLLNFTAGNGQLELFWTHGVASIRRIGATLQITDEQFARVWTALPLSVEMRQRVRRCETSDEKFAALWQLLPLPDTAIACLLQTERQKVINLRKAAGDRLSRSMLR